MLGGDRGARRDERAREWWPTVAIHGEATQELPSPRAFRAADGVGHRGARSPRSSRAAPTPDATWARIEAYVDAGYDHVYLHQVGPDQAGFIKFAEGELLPALKPEALRLAS